MTGTETGDRREQSGVTRSQSGPSRRGRLRVVSLTTVAIAMLVLVAACGGSDSESTSAGTTQAPVETGAPADTGAASETGAPDESAGGPIVVGYAAALTGVPAGDSFALQGVEYQVDQINAAGGVGGRQIELITKDMKSDPALGGTVAQELLDAGAQILIGPPFPGLAAGVIQTAAGAQVSVISAESTQPEYVVVGGAPAFLTAFGDNVQAAAAAEYALGQGYTTAYTLVSPDLSYTSATPEWFAEAFENGGGTMAGTSTFSLGQQDFSPIVTEIANLDTLPDVIYTAAFGTDLTTFLRQLREANIETPVIGADGLDSPEIPKALGDAAEGLVFTTHGFPEPGSDYAAFIDGLTEFQGKAPEAPGLAALGASTVQLIAAAAEQAESSDPHAIGAALASLADVPTVTGSVTYEGTDGVPIKPVALVRVENGEFVLVDTITPSFIPAPS